MTTKTEWILYGLTQRDTLEKYIGVHKGDVSLDNYITSSTNPHLKEAIVQDKIDRVILARGDKEEMYNQEYYFLSKYDAVNNPKFFNKSNGGGPGVKKTYRPEKKHEKNVVKWVDNNEWVDANALFLSTNKKTESKAMIALWKQLKDSIENWKDGGTKEYPVEEVSVHTLYVVDHNQARAVKLDQQKLSDLVTAFRNPGYARKNITPVIVMVKDGKIVLLLDGNHRVNAASIADWDTYPVIKVDHSIFKDSAYNFNFFGNLMNHVEADRKGNNLDDLIMRLRELHAHYPRYRIESDMFKEIAKEELGGKNTRDGGMWKNADVVRKCDELAKADREALAREQSKKNFIDYTSSRLSTVWYQSKHFNEHPTIFQSLDGINNGGIGGAVAYAAQNYAENGVNEANIVIHFKSLSGYLTDAPAAIAKLRQTLEFGVKSKINIYFADPFKEQIVTKLNGLST